MSANPYQSPTPLLDPVVATTPTRDRARASLRIAFVVLLLPAVYNYYAFDAQAIGGSGMPSSLAGLLRMTNIIGFVIGGAAIWFLGLPLLERVAQMIRFVFANNTNANAWNETLYRSINSTVYLAIPGAILWAVWVLGFYYLGFDFFVISWAVGIPAHLLGACLYLPLLVRWYRLSLPQPAS